MFFARSNVLHVREVLEGSLSPPVRLLLKRPPHASRLLAESTNTKGATPSCTSVRVIANRQGIASLEVSRDYDVVEYLLQPNRSSWIRIEIHEASSHSHPQSTPLGVIIIRAWDALTDSVWGLAFQMNNKQFKTDLSSESVCTTSGRSAKFCQLVSYYWQKCIISTPKYIVRLCSGLKTLWVFCE